MVEAVKVPRVDRAHLGEPPSCPFCGGMLGPMFGLRVVATEQGQANAPVLDATRAQCRACKRVFVTED